MDPQQQFCLKWNSFGSNLVTTFDSLFKSESLTDVTLFCEGSFLSTFITFVSFNVQNECRLDTIFNRGISILNTDSVRNVDSLGIINLARAALS